ncbi:hypothetical protein YPPY04_4561, partial [Yersinia pestis PY-04]
MGRIRKPQPHINTKSGNISQCHNNHFKGIGPARQEPRQWPQITAGG